MKHVIYYAPLTKQIMLGRVKEGTNFVSSKIGAVTEQCLNSSFDYLANNQKCIQGRFNGKWCIMEIRPMTDDEIKGMEDSNAGKGG